jgi:hypothetical protein
MKSRYLPVVVASLLLSVSPGFAGDQTPAALPAPLSKESRTDIIRVFTADLVFAHTAFPMGKEGLRLKNGIVSPSAEELQSMIMEWGAAAKPGDRAIISAVFVKPDRIRFEINGGPVRKKKWYQRIEVDGTAGPVPTGNAPDSETNMHGSFVDLMFDRYVPELSAKQVKELLRPVFDFEAKSTLEAYLETVPPKVKEAIQQHHVLVGMNRDMVIYAKGRAPKKDREKDGDMEYEEWIYGEPPEAVDFVRFVGDEVVRVETMTVTGQKVIRSEKEIELAAKPDSTKASQADARPASAPTLRRPGEAPDPHEPRSGTISAPTQVPDSPPPIDNGKGGPPAPADDGSGTPRP